MQKNVLINHPNQWRLCPWIPLVTVGFAPDPHVGWHSRFNLLGGWKELTSTGWDDPNTGDWGPAVYAYAHR